MSVASTVMISVRGDLSHPWAVEWGTPRWIACWTSPLDRTSFDDHQGSPKIKAERRERVQKIAECRDRLQGEQEMLHLCSPEALNVLSALEDAQASTELTA